MAEIEKPLKGGSYIRSKDGRLRRVGGTEPARPAATAVAPVADPPVADAPETSKKGK